ncbi:MAG TPA: hypothetical protein VF846_16265 [Thermoanaerobaculia bacterium]|jgi:hypothetical protein
MLRYRIPLVLVVALGLACKQQAPPSTTARRAAGPQVQATVVTIRTTIEPPKQTQTHAVMIVGDRARHTAEQDTWRLFDTKANTITFIDDVAKTIRVEKLADATRQRRAAIASALPPHYPRLRLRATSTTKPLHGVNATQSIIEHGGYRRELWLAEHPSIPKGLFAMIHASAPPSSPLAPMMRAVDEALLATSGFPMLDRSEITYGNQKMVIERAVVSIEQRSVAEGALAVPRDYEDITPKPAPPKKKKKS